MKRILLSLLAFAIAFQPVMASNCFQSSFGGVCSPARRVISYSAPVVKRVQKVVQPYVEEKYVNVQHYFIGAPANLGYAPLQAAQYGQIQRNVQRSIDMLRELQQYQQQYQQMQQPVYAPQQYVPQSIPQYAAPVQQQYAAPQQCQGCGGQLLQQQQAPCNCQQPLQQPAYQQPLRQGYQQTLAQLPQGAVMQQNCAQCHAGANAKGNFNIADVPRMNTDDRMHVLEMAASGEMPKDAQDLNDEQLGQLARELFAGSGQAATPNGSGPNGAATLPPVEQAPPASQFNGAH